MPSKTKGSATGQKIANRMPNVAEIPAANNKKSGTGILIRKSFSALFIFTVLRFKGYGLERCARKVQEHTVSAKKFLETQIHVI